jgi:catechol 2,3-dioxygenase-like lactoylglutathione lyase family enzyme
MENKQTSVYVEDQDKALKFYTEVLGFVKKLDITAGKYRWLTVVSPENQNGVQLVLEPNDHPPRKPIRKLFLSKVFAQHPSLWKTFKRSMQG